ncbi:MoaF-related domain-containing protein [Methylophilus aquaticus]|uniref:MoaF C-terminal domain-containing protein n=1 Tax=Methylophilus aquaticus TaxID=1971610 RepID=A0ABT9JSV7_9PROT|nr:MoaF C-terminal domain-containing protein [Methylophilus aquaticus]MDP8567549.1 MoaF C-terminal domain-containing protein [Methylophilus aquaticus]
MQGWIRSGIGFLLLAASQSVWAAQPWQGQFLYSYEGGSVYRVTANHQKSMHWECIQGEEAGASGEELPERIQVRPDIYFVSWTEKSGVQVTQVLDFKSMKVYSTIIDQSARYVLRGSIKREK